MKKALISVASGATLIALAVAQPAAAATEFGDNCDGNAPVPTYTLTTLSTPDATLPLTAPTSGVLTKVKVKVTAALPFSIPEQIKVLRSTGGNNYTVTKQATIQVTAGENVADVRIPIQSGDKLGTRGLPFKIGESESEGASIICTGVPGVLGGVAGDVGEGSTAEFKELGEARLPLRGVIEPDADNDGYGDESQDGCPQSGAVQTPSPLIVLDISPSAGKKSAIVYVAANATGAISVKGTVSLGKGKKTTLKAGPKTVNPGQIVSFKLKFNSKLQKRLKELQPSKKLTLKVTASATNVAGLVSTDSAKVGLKGQA